MMTDALYERLNGLRERYERKMTEAADGAEIAMNAGYMDECSIQSTASERYREAAHALKLAIQIVEEEKPDDDIAPTGDEGK